MAVINYLPVKKGGGPPPVTSGKYLVQVVDFDGTILKSAKLNTGDTFTLPSNPTHDGLVFQGWSSPVTITNNAVTVGDSDITMGPMYETSSGKSEFDITLTAVTGLSISLKFSGTVDWGDGTTETTTSNPSTHTYASAGDYTIKITGLTSIDGYFFGQSSSINANYYCTAIRLGSSVTSIGSSVFHYCYSLTSITIPEGVTSIGNGVFNYCYSLTSITIPDGVTSIGNYAFGSCYSLTSITIPDGVTSIGSYVFQYCYALASITIPEGVTSIGGYAFYNCSSLTSITIPDGVTSIGGYAFYNCSSLTSITIPDGVTSIGYSAFSYCRSIIEYDMTALDTPPTLEDVNAFTDINKICKMKVKASALSAFQTATNWSNFADYMVGV